MSRTSIYTVITRKNFLETSHCSECFRPCRLMVIEYHRFAYRSPKRNSMTVLLCFFVDGSYDQNYLNTYEFRSCIVLAVVTGWGRVSENGVFAHVLQKVQLPLLPIDICLNMYIDAGYGDYVNRCVICGGGLRDHEADSCQVCDGSLNPTIILGIVVKGVYTHGG